jgi:hypothetical protein
MGTSSQPSDRHFPGIRNKVELQSNIKSAIASPILCLKFGMQDSNWNNRYWVCLTPKGKCMWVTHWRSLGCDTPRHGMPDADGWIHLSLHEIAYVFGAQMYMGNNALPFVHMDLFAEKPSSE